MRVEILDADYKGKFDTFVTEKGANFIDGVLCKVTKGSWIFKEEYLERLTIRRVDYTDHVGDKMFKYVPIKEV